MRFGPLYRNLPALEHLGKMNMDGAIVGLLCLAISIVMGALLSHRLGQSMAGDPKIIQSVVVWFAYALLVLGYWKAGWSGRFLVNLSLLCFCFLIVSMLVVMVFFQTFHSFG